jgi:hypothetical protein
MYCLDCHDAETAKGDVVLEHDVVDWSKQPQRELWERALHAVELGQMPPKKKPQPAEDDRQVLAAWLDMSLLDNTPIGGTLPRRLNRNEYQATIQALFNMPHFKLPMGFPKDTEMHGFDNVGEGLVMSPSLLEAYSKVAWQVADELYPPPQTAAKSIVRRAGPEDMVLSFSAAVVRDNTLRLASRANTIMRSCSWPSRIEITTSGIYRITVNASTFKPASDEPMVLELRARDVTASDRSNVKTFRLLKEVMVNSESAESATFEAELYEGQTVLLRWKNAPMDHEPIELYEQMLAWFKRDPRVLAAWQNTVFPDGTVKGGTTHLRGRNGWNILKGHLDDPDLDVSKANLDGKLTTALLSRFNSNEGRFNLGDALCHYYHENGPSLEIHGLLVEGPLQLVDGPKEKRRGQMRRQLAGVERGDLSNEAYARKMLASFLPRAFRRPVDKQTLNSFLRIAKRHWETGHSFEAGMHLMLRDILISPRFLYRCLEQPGKLDSYDLATRLSYFLRQSPPDARLTGLARAGKLSDPATLRAEALRLMPSKPGDAFVSSFTGQWLDTRLLPGIMPDPKFGFTPYYVEMARDEVEYSFAEMIRKNRPMTDFIDPDFTYTSSTFANNVYKMNVKLKGEKTDRELQRLPIARGGRHGGLLGQSAVMMATANGVDTQPVVRGVWVLENILGMPTPEPPKDVPALTPDTRGGTTPRQLLSKHTADAKCAGCHERIDPIGFMLENYDPVGRWRERWPKSNARINAGGTLPNGAPAKDVSDLKKWLLGNTNVFSECLAEKLMIYATGRKPNYAERKEIEKLVEANRENGNGFRDLILTLVQSETFQTK